MSRAVKDAQTEPDPRPKAIGSGRSGRVRSAVRRMLAEVRTDPKRWSLEHELTAMNAELLAALVDRHAAAGDGNAMRQAIKDLTELVDKLPVRISTGEEGPAGDSGDDRASLVLVMDSPPTVGDAANS